MTKKNISNNSNINIKDKGNNLKTLKNSLSKHNISRKKTFFDKNIKYKNIRNKSNTSLANNKSQYTTKLNNHNPKKINTKINKNNDFFNNKKYANSTETRIGIESFQINKFINPFSHVENKKKRISLKKIII